MPDTPLQPSLPAEGNFTEAEIGFMEDSPPGLFPENQDSNFGFVFRKLFSDQVQRAADQQLTIWSERFPDTSTVFLDVWEAELGLPVAPTGLTVAQRRSIVQGRLSKGAFTRNRRWEIVKKFVYATTGTVIQFSPDGVPLVSGGVELHSEPISHLDAGVPFTSSGLALTADGIIFTSDLDAFNIVEDVSAFSYDVRIKTSITPDVPGLTRELERMTPAHLTFTITSTDILYP